MQNEKRAKAAARGSGVPALYEPPTGVVSREDTYPTDLVCGCRIIQRLVYVDFLLVSFAIVWAVRVGEDTWEEEYSCDSGHGHFHQHIFGHKKPNDARNIMPLYSQADVEQCFDKGYDLVEAHHEKHCGGGK